MNDLFAILFSFVLRIGVFIGCVITSLFGLC